MIKLRKRPRDTEGNDEGRDSRYSTRKIQLTNPDHGFPEPTTIRDKLLQREVMELNPEVLPVTVHVSFPNPNALHQFCVHVSPNEGMWKFGTYTFSVVVPEDYNMSPPRVKCLTPIWHPNIAYPGGQVCLSLLRVAPADNLGWTPTRHLKDLVLGLDALFGDLVNFEDPLNTEAADMFSTEPTAFVQRVNEFIAQSRRGLPPH